MDIGLYQSAASLSALERWQDAVSQNITSGQVTGYRKRTVEFSAQEGGIDASFLTFHNETDFLRKFFGLTLDAEKCAAVRQVVVVWWNSAPSKCRRMRRCRQPRCC